MAHPAQGGAVGRRVGGYTMAIEEIAQNRMSTAGESFVATRVNNVPPSGIRKFFDIVATMKDVISLGIGEPDFVSPQPILEAGINSLRAGHTAYTSNSGIFELRNLLSEHLNRLFTVRDDP